MKISRRVFRTAVVCVAMSFSVPTLASAQTVLTTATVNTVGSLANRMGNRFRDLVAEANSTLSVNHVEGTVLGNSQQVIEQVISGAVDIMGNDMAWVAPYDKDLTVLNWSFTFRDRDHYAAYFKSDLFQEVVERMAADTGIRVLGAVPSQPRYLHSRVPITSAADIVDLKVRVPQIKTFINSWEAMGAVPTPLNYVEVFLAMTTGVVDLAFGSPSDTFVNNFHLAGPNIVRTGDTIGSYMLVINEARYQSLTDEEKAVLQKAADEALVWASNEANLEMESVIEDMIATGANIRDIDLTPLRDATLAAGRKMEASGEWSVGLLDAIQELK